MQVDTAEGRVGLWSRADGYTRIGEVPTGGIGPGDGLRRHIKGLPRRPRVDA